MKSKRRKCLLMVAMVVSLVFLVVSIYLIYLYINPALFRHTGIYKYNSSLRPILIAVNENSDLILCYTFSIASVKPPSVFFYLAPPPQAMNVVAVFTLVPILVAFLFILILKLSTRGTTVSPLSKKIAKPARVILVVIVMLVSLFMLVYGMLPVFYESYISIDDGRVGIHQLGLPHFMRSSLKRRWPKFI